MVEKMHFPWQQSPSTMHWEEPWARQVHLSSTQFPSQQSVGPWQLARTGLQQSPSWIPWRKSRLQAIPLQQSASEAQPPWPLIAGLPQAQAWLTQLLLAQSDGSTQCWLKACLQFPLHAPEQHSALLAQLRLSNGWHGPAST